MWVERRKAPRTRAEAGTVVTCTSEDSSSNALSPPNLATRVLDFGPRGACILTVSPVRESLPLIVDIFIPRSGARFRTRSHVRWSVTLESKGRVAHAAGLQFDRILECIGERARALFGSPTDKAPSRTPEPRRRHKRFALKDARIVVTPRDLWRSIGFESNPALALRNLSLGGGQIVSSQKLRPGQHVDMSIECAAPYASIQAEAEICWCRRDTLSLVPRWHAGLEFKRVPEPGQKNLQSLDRFYLG
jgi:hypothetical protein